MAIGNGLTHCEIQYQTYTDYALNMKLLTQDEHEKLKAAVSQCLQEAVAQTVELNVRKHMEIAITSSATSWQLIWVQVERFLTLKFVKTAIGVSDIEFVSCSSKVYKAMLQDWMRNLEVGIPIHFLRMRSSYLYMLGNNLSSGG
ncbi:serine carboxypeptidase-like 48 [Primulina huaijiensis]|uniref:serine carboxypeptidase-like 48 n=1 Tax=Primulina huaijiensis TaxID=1492673 RepID=UPI003CC73E88